MLSERQIACQSCGVEFVFSSDEQAFYQSKGFQDPKKCKTCRDLQKQGRTGQGSQRQLYDVVCASCGISTQVPFRPTGSKPVYCRDCFQGSSGGGGQHSTGAML